MDCRRLEYNTVLGLPAFGQRLALSPKRSGYGLAALRSRRRPVNCAKGFESALANAEAVRWEEKRWRDGDQIDRRVGRGVAVAGRQFRKVSGHRQIPVVLCRMADAVSKKPVAKGVTVAQFMSFTDCVLITEFRAISR